MSFKYLNSYSKIPSKQFNLKKYSSYSLIKESYFTSPMPYTWSGLIHGEGSITIIICKDDRRKIGWCVCAKAFKILIRTTYKRYKYIIFITKITKWCW